LKEQLVADRGIRSLAHLQNRASTARLLNLLAIWHRSKDLPEYSEQPFFQNPRLNRAMILKHQLRPDELDLFDPPRLTATKLVFPVDPNDLRLGGRFVFVGQKGFAGMLEAITGEPDRKTENLDLPLLKILDDLPSLDPFLLREELRRNGYKPADCYLQLSAADLERIFAFVQSEIEPLIQMSLGGQTASARQTTRLVEKILSNTIDVEMKPLQEVLGLTESAFAEGIFCWKGFLYYKWVYRSIESSSPRVIATILNTRPIGAVDPQMRAQLDRVSKGLANRIGTATKSIKALLDIYDNAYRDLTQRSKTASFRDFLLNAPLLFTDLGGRLGVLQHIMSFCEFRFPANKPVKVSPSELFDIFSDFDGNLYVQAQTPEKLAS
jgi:hypothetical protein